MMWCLQTWGSLLACLIGCGWKGCWSRLWGRDGVYLRLRLSKVLLEWYWCFKIKSCSYWQSWFFVGLFFFNVSITRKKLSLVFGNSLIFLLMRQKKKWFLCPVLSFLRAGDYSGFYLCHCSRKGLQPGLGSLQQLGPAASTRERPAEFLAAILPAWLSLVGRFHFPFVSLPFSRFCSCPWRNFHCWRRCGPY